VRSGLTDSAPILEFALMGADEESETKSKSVETSLVASDVIYEANGLQLGETSDGQIVLIVDAGRIAPENRLTNR
jgi:hypothetical protein